MRRSPRVAFFTDSYEEANGIARLTREFELYAARRDLPFLCVHASTLTSLGPPGPRLRLRLGRSAAAFRLEHDLRFDPLLWRHVRLVRHVVREFQPDILHVTGPSDVGQLGAYLGHRLSIPMVGSWHTNLHQYAALRSQKWLRWLPKSLRIAVQGGMERQVLRAAVLFYRVPRVVLAPNEDLVRLLSERLHRPTYLMRHGVDTAMFSPDKRTRAAGAAPLQIGFVGRLSAEKHVRVLATLERALCDAGIPCTFVLVGEGAERHWLERHMTAVQCHGVLTGDALSRVYADLDVFVFPSPSDTFGLVVLEAMASGLPVVAMARGGPRFLVETGTTGWLARDDDELVAATLRLARDRALRE
jgi:phosphatidylinositol alpha 1,6-mannosyltransferase